MNFSAVVMDGQGHTLPYTAQYDESAHTIQTFLPDGSYTLLVTAVGAQSRLSSSDGLRKFRAQVAMLGQVAVAVAGRAVSTSGFRFRSRKAILCRSPLCARARRECIPAYSLR